MSFISEYLKKKEEEMEMNYPIAEELGIDVPWTAISFSIELENKRYSGGYISLSGSYGCYEEVDYIISFDAIGNEKYQTYEMVKVDGVVKEKWTPLTSPK
jgi:hypothetical protein